MFSIIFHAGSYAMELATIGAYQKKARVLDREIEQIVETLDFSDKTRSKSELGTEGDRRPLDQNQLSQKTHFHNEDPTGSAILSICNQFIQTSPNHPNYVSKLEEFRNIILEAEASNIYYAWHPSKWNAETKESNDQIKNHALEWFEQREAGAIPIDQPMGLDEKVKQLRSNRPTPTLQQNGLAEKAVRKLITERLLVIVHTPRLKRCQDQEKTQQSALESFMKNLPKTISIDGSEQNLNTYSITLITRYLKCNYGVNAIENNDLTLAYLQCDLGKKVENWFLCMCVLNGISHLTHFSSNPHILKSILEHGTALGSLGVLFFAVVPCVWNVIKFCLEKHTFNDLREQGIADVLDAILKKLLDPQANIKEKQE